MDPVVRSVDNDGIKIAYDIVGEGQTIVFVHGITEHRDSWTPVTDRLAAEFRCVRLDLRGHGTSERVPAYDIFGFVSDLATVMAAECETPPVVVGHSLGGIVATVNAALNPTGPVISIDQPLELGGFAAITHAIAPRLRDPATFADALMDEKRALGIELVLEPQRTELERASRLCDPQAVLDTWRAMLDGDDAALHDDEAGLASLVTAITVPYLALHGEPVSDGYEDRLRAMIPTANYELWDGLGHWLHLVEPDRFATRVRAFVAST